MYSVPPLQSPHGLNHCVQYHPIQHPQLPSLLPPPPALQVGVGPYIQQLEGEPLDLNVDLNVDLNAPPFIMQRCHRAHFLEETPVCHGSAQITPLLALRQPPRPKFRPSSTASQRTQIAHPYARLFAKKDEVKHRKTWNHALEKSIFDPTELYVELSHQSFWYSVCRPLI